MGSACCVAARDRTIVNGASGEVLHRNVRYSPSWSFRWDSRGRVAGEVEPSISWASDGVSRMDGLDMKSGTDGEMAYTSDVGSPLENFQNATWRKTPVPEGSAEKLRPPLSVDQSITRNFSTEAKDSTESPAVSDLSFAKLSASVPSVSSLSNSPLSSQSNFHPASSTPSRWPRRSPGHQLFRQVSDSRIPGLKSPSNCSIYEDRSSSAVPCSNESTRGSHGGSSDGWSVRAFTELMASSHRERWSFDSEFLGFSRDKTARSSSRMSSSASIDMQTCGVCSRLLTEKSLWGGQKIIISNELSVVAVLICGHVYHAECLENITPEIDKYDPACPICTYGEKQTLKLSEKVLRAEIEMKARNHKRSRSRVVDSDLDGDSAIFERWKGIGNEGKGPKFGPSSSKNSLARPFLRRHFSFGSKALRSSSENHSTKRKGLFWTKSMK
ncbi:hypothetical protein RJ641_013823 [Dillenia turbinata]|uniref:RING-type domain-containing protein n=1 Tax=Dillenia turbinata TaxID=194707 RepID=A0AAN8WAP8_9MAGN